MAIAYDKEAVSYRGFPLSSKDAADFLTEVGAPQPCESCSGDEWYISISPGSGATAAINIGPMEAVPVFLVTCMQCALVRTHAIEGLLAWHQDPDRPASG